MKIKFVKCSICGQIVEVVKETPVPVMCCGQPMKELIAGEVEASQEKHIPEYVVEDNIVKVKIGSVEHPMVAEHYIEWIVVETEKGVQRQHLLPNMKPYAEFSLHKDDVVKSVYAYCNLHGLWKA